MSGKTSAEMLPVILLLIMIAITIISNIIV